MDIIELFWIGEEILELKVEIVDALKLKQLELYTTINSNHVNNYKIITLKVQFNYNVMNIIADRNMGH
jgi:hypothetical protein